VFGRHEMGGAEVEEEEEEEEWQHVNATVLT
jgi:hypothetical protein